MKKSNWEAEFQELYTTVLRKAYMQLTTELLHLRLPISFVGQMPKLITFRKGGSSYTLVFEIGTVERKDAFPGYSVGNVSPSRMANLSVQSVPRMLEELLGIDLDIESYTLIELTISLTKPWLGRPKVLLRLIAIKELSPSSI